jgi:hypothetical protein
MAVSTAPAHALTANDARCDGGRPRRCRSRTTRGHPAGRHDRYRTSRAERGASLAGGICAGLTLGPAAPALAGDCWYIPKGTAWAQTKVPASLQGDRRLRLSVLTHAVSGMKDWKLQGRLGAGSWSLRYHRNRPAL